MPTELLDVVPRWAEEGTSMLLFGSAVDGSCMSISSSYMVFNLSEVRSTLAELGI